MKQVNFTDDHGILQTDAIQEEAPTEIKAQMPEVINKCNVINEKYACRTAYAQLRCLTAEMKQLEGEYTKNFQKEQEVIRDLQNTMQKWYSKAVGLEDLGLNSDAIDHWVQEVKVWEASTEKNITMKEAKNVTEIQFNQN